MSKSFSQKLEKMDLDFLAPLENSYKKVKASESIIVDFDFEIKAKKADMKIGFALFPEGKNALIFPHIKVSNMAISAATNENEEARLVLHEMSKENLESYHADWGAVVFFNLKEFSQIKIIAKCWRCIKKEKGWFIFFICLMRHRRKLICRKIV